MSHIGWKDGKLRFPSLTSDPATIETGEVWYRSDTNKLRARINGGNQDIASPTQKLQISIADIKQPSSADPVETVIDEQTPVLEFASGTLNKIFFTTALPINYKNDSNIKWQMTWAPSNTDTGDVLWKADYKIVKPDSGDLIDSTSNATSSITGTASGTVNESNRTPEGTLTISNADPDDWLHLRIYRDAGDAADTFTGDARLSGIELTITNG